MSPYVLLSILVGALYGALFHLWRGQKIRDLLIYLFAGIVGFWLGQLLGNMLQSDIFLIGPLHILEASALSWISLFIIQWLKI